MTREELEAATADLVEALCVICVGAHDSGGGLD
jgi:hypothetical protein